jgi:hypothetical protein
MSGTASIADIEELLKNCAPGFTSRNTTHALQIKYNGKSYPSLPSYKDIELGHIRKMVRTLEINKECANKYIPGLFKLEKVEKPDEPGQPAKKQ